MQQKSYPDIFFFHDNDWSHQGVLRKQLDYCACYQSALGELAKLESILSDHDSLLRGFAMQDYAMRAISARRDDLLQPENIQDYYDYLFTTAKPKTAAIKAARDDLYGLVKKHNL